ncbi:unnamed protein product, partial [marine sediment metagenome]
MKEVEDDLKLSADEPTEKRRRNPKTWGQVIKAMFSEGNTASCMRLCVTIIIVTYMFNWSWACIASGTFISMPIANLVGLIGVLGLKVG